MLQLGTQAAPTNEDRDDIPTRRDLARISAVQQRAELQAVLGTIFVNTTMLPLVGGDALGPARDRNGNVLRWSIWAPHRRVLIDSWRIEPPTSEKEDRQAFADAHDLRYAAVGRGMKLTAKSVKEWLE